MAYEAMSRNVTDDNTVRDGTREYLSFRLGSEEYGIPILTVQEIRGYEPATRMVSAPSYILGVLNLRGFIVPILDIRIKFGLANAAYDSQTVTIVLNIGTRVVGMVVDAVSDVVALKASEIKPAPEMSDSIATQYITGIATIEQAQEQRMLILMDIEQFMRSAEMGLIAQAVSND